MDTQKKETHFVIRTNDVLKNEYRTFCDENGYTMSKRIISLIKQDIKNNGKK